jgi:ATP synthase protein I
LRALDFQAARRAAFGIVLGQFAASLLVAGLIAIIFGAGTGYSALLGGVIGVVSSLYMAVAFFRQGEGADAGKILRGVYRGEAVKIALTAGLMIVAIVGLRAEFLPLFGGYMATIVVYWAALLNASPADNAKP